ncbi:peptidylprolyl isomerase [Arcanobacterium wilhelmae]|uniref:Peptidyl-prolyl cis-trans isomerase n=1 Tax=Arcanobacterium wilhelmae TaxID=1803177 RepID=A0ABT9N900_9ACTO|nr:FKBP-type peptidyl-prolyl cis-trans isomerase [Arcanobacterium wilhelmae]MDP9800179.1 peptidylprolyl isomerase [Arcanobacterium wilhelmae]
MRKFAALVLAGALSLSLAACGSSKPSSEGSASAPASSAAPAVKPDTNPDAATMPTVTGSAKTTKLAFPKSDAPSGLKVLVLEEGKGRVLEPTDTVVAHYVGQVWGNDTPFDSSFSRGAPAAFSLQGVIPGWTQGLSGQKVGSKLIVSIPSELGYAEGNDQAGIKKGDTIAFYIELVDGFGKDSSGDPKAKATGKLKDLPVTYKGDLGKPVTDLKVKDGQAVPEKSEAIVIAEGSGPKIDDGKTFYYQSAAVNWDPKATSVSSYDQGGAQATTFASGNGLDPLKGIRAGSRVFFVMVDPNNPNAKAQAFIIDIVAVH